MAVLLAQEREPLYLMSQTNMNTPWLTDHKINWNYNVKVNIHFMRKSNTFILHLSANCVDVVFLNYFSTFKKSYEKIQPSKDFKLKNGSCSQVIPKCTNKLNDWYFSHLLSKLCKCWFNRNIPVILIWHTNNRAEIKMTKKEPSSHRFGCWMTRIWTSSTFPGTNWISIYRIGPFWKNYFD